jgi:hypothetical protein
MRKTTVALGVAAVLFGGVAASPMSSTRAAPLHSVAAKATKCSVGAYKHARCYVVPSTGTFKVEVPDTDIVLQGKGNTKDSGHEIIVQHISMPSLRKGEQAFKVITSGSIPPLTLISPGTLYKYNPATGKWHKVKAVKGTGIYKVRKP